MTETLLRQAEASGVTVRVVGSIAYRLHCAGHASYLDAMEREVPPDIDLVVPGRDRHGLRALFEELGYQENRDILLAMEGRRYGYTYPSNGFKADVFVDRLEFCHPIPLKGRFGLDAPTVPLAELALSKLQIVKINEKDLKDLSVLLLEHELGPGDRERIDGQRIADLLAEDWGFYYTVSLNVQKLHRFLERCSVMSQAERATVARRLDSLMHEVEQAPKSLRWKLRAKVGPRVQWYQDVSEMEPTW